jgi:hypothetical protein
MCNVWNHSPECRCGFGGAGHLGRRSYGNLYSQGMFLSKNCDIYNFGLPFHSQHDYSSFSAHFVNPNAKCPVCGEKVFFCQLENGGRVYFDELGPPWSKHPCTDSKNKHLPTVSIVSKTTIILEQDTHSAPSNFGITPPFLWQKEGWLPFLCFNAYVVHGNYIKLEGVLEQEEFSFFIKGLDIIQDIKYSPILVKQITKYEFELSTFTMDFSAFSDLRMAHAASIREKNKLRHIPKIPINVVPKSKPANIKPKTNPDVKKPREVKKSGFKTVMELAFEKANTQ